MLICDEFMHKVTGRQFATFIAEFETLANGASLDPAGFAKPGGFLAFASIATLIPSSIPAFVANMTGQAPPYTPQ